MASSAAEAADTSAAAAKRRQFAAFIGGLSDEEIEASLLCLPTRYGWSFRGPPSLQ